MRRRIALSAVSVFFLLSLPNPASAQIEVVGLSPGPWLIVGTVEDVASEQPIPSPDVLVRDSLGNVVLAVTGNRAGVFRFQPPSAGQYELTVSRIGYASIQGALRIPEEGTVMIQVSLPVDPVQLEGVEARVRGNPKHMEMTLDGFRARSSSAAGTFFDEEQIEKRKPSRITDLVVRAPGVSILRSGGRAVDVKILRGQGGSFRPPNLVCLPDIWLDGIRVREGRYAKGSEPGLLFLNDVIQPEQIGGMEVYTGLSQIPIQFRGSSSSCGSIVIWSRRQ